MCVCVCVCVTQAFDGEGNLFFTDSGPFGETSLEKPKGSVFCVEVADQLLKPLALEVFFFLVSHSIVCIMCKI